MPTLFSPLIDYKYVYIYTHTHTYMYIRIIQGQESFWHLSTAGLATPAVTAAKKNDQFSANQPGFIVCQP